MIRFLFSQQLLYEIFSVLNLSFLYPVPPFFPFFYVFVFVLVLRVFFLCHEALLSPVGACVVGGRRRQSQIRRRAVMGASAATTPLLR